MKISVVSPCHTNDLYCLPNYFSHLNNQTRLPDEVVIYIQPIKDYEFNVYDYIDKKVDVKIITSEIPTPMGFNKNRAVENTSGDILCFMDIDDEPHPQKLEIVENFFKTNENCDILLHTYQMNNSKILEAKFDVLNIPYDMLKTYHSNGTYVDEEPSYPLHKAHGSIKKEIWEKTKFREEQNYFRRDDSEFILDNFNKGTQIYSINYNLVNFVK
jgi:glycosyltransferase involved in cell wall biosynthesis